MDADSPIYGVKFERRLTRDWVLRFNASGLSGLIDGKPTGKPRLLKSEHRAALAHAIEEGPIPAIHGVVRWRIVDLCQRLFEEFRLAVSPQTLGRELREMGYRKLSARPRHHAQAEGAIDDFKKAFSLAWRKSRATKASASIR